MPRADCLSVFERNFMRIDLRRATLGEGRVRHPMYIEKWSDHYQDAAAQLIAAAYTGHVDSRINDQYRSAAGARRFLYNIVQYPGCGAFYRPASLRRLRCRDRPPVRHLARQHRRARMRAHHPDLRLAVGARNGHRPRAAAAIADDLARDGLPLRQPDGHRGQ